MSAAMNVLILMPIQMFLDGFYTIPKRNKFFESVDHKELRKTQGFALNNSMNEKE